MLVTPNDYDKHKKRQCSVRPNRNERVVFAVFSFA
jgi:hypothetical protein